jgi:hypothetical protein
MPASERENSESVEARDGRPPQTHATPSSSVVVAVAIADASSLSLSSPHSECCPVKRRVVYRSRVRGGCHCSHPPFHSSAASASPVRPLHSRHLHLQSRSRFHARASADVVPTSHFRQPRPCGCPQGEPRRSPFVALPWCHLSNFPIPSRPTSHFTASQRRRLPVFFRYSASSLCYSCYRE